MPCQLLASARKWWRQCSLDKTFQAKRFWSAIATDIDRRSQEHEIMYIVCFGRWHQLLLSGLEHLWSLFKNIIKSTPLLHHIQNTSGTRKLGSSCEASHGQSWSACQVSCKLIYNHQLFHYKYFSKSRSSLKKGQPPASIASQCINSHSAFSQGKN